jgi:hypothetical protein
MHPADVQSYARSAELTEIAVPPGLPRDSTKAGDWGLA